MEDLTRLVDESMARHGIKIAVDHRHLQWSPWLRCQSSFELVLVPSKPGLVAVSEELTGPRQIPGASGQRMLVVLQLYESQDLGIAISRLLGPNSPFKDRLATGRIFTRYTIIEEEAQRRAAHASLQEWLTASAETASGMASGFGIPANLDSHDPAVQPAIKAAPLPAGF